MQTAETAARSIVAMGVTTVLVTMGSLGVYVAGPQSFHSPAFSVIPVDTVAAGDIFCGTLAVALSEEKEIGEAVRFASAAAAISVTRPGAQDSAPSRNEIEALLKSDT